MADASKLKHLRRSGLGAPPPMEEARSDLAPLPDQADRLVGREVEEHRDDHGSRIAQPHSSPPRIDGRTLRRSGRTVQFATRVSPEFDERIRQIAQREGLLLVEVLERALEALEARR
jgi:hypothetical protein